MNTSQLSTRGFIPLIFMLIAFLSTATLSGVGYGVYKYKQTAKENVELREQIETQKDQQIQELQEKIETLTTQDKGAESTTTVNESVPVITKKIQVDNSAFYIEEKRLAAQKAYEETERQKQIIAQQAASKAEAALLLVETCKAKRDAQKTDLWDAMLIAVDLAEQQNEDEKLESLMASIPPGAMSASSIFKLAKTTDIQHQENLSIAETKMESSLADFYEKCLNGE